MSKSILVTGAAGFIASHVCDALLARGDRVVGIDNFNDYYDPDRKHQNVADVRSQAPQGAQYDLQQLDFCDTEGLRALFEGESFDAIVHLGAMAGVRASMDAPQLYMDVNIGGTVNLLEAARRHGIEHFVFASTSSVYGGTTQIPFIETDPCNRPLAPYPASKRSAELLGYSYHHLYGLHFTALRFFTVYGPRMRPDMMAYKLLDNIFRGRAVPLYNKGQMHRDWTYVSDIVQGVVAAIDRPMGYEQINLGRGSTTLLADFVARIEQLAGARSNLDDQPMPAADMLQTYADVSKAERLLGYRPTVDVADGTERFYRWYRAAVVTP